MARWKRMDTYDGMVNSFTRVCDFEIRKLGWSQRCKGMWYKDTWVAASGKNSMRRDRVIRDCKSGEILTRASSYKELSKIHDEVRTEIEQYFVDTPPVIDDDSIKLPKLDENTADHVRNGLTSAPQPIVENYELASITLEYRRECMKDSVLQSLTSSQALVVFEL
ncbi:hypothetical protein QVD17_06993 [Tagetes erecta]|uniref:Acyl-ACP thioesterase-like C-terminal domain-containing protein n=1 Tax=Tagetes erecta TaxID=13708 RepID=A0AAD8PCA9_TARER|nr:hypothetical protein QVD17_06993 [Tagetes erecta]